MRKALFANYWASRSPDRIFLVEKLLPAYSRSAKNILWVGCQKYTRSYAHILESHGAACWTIEIDPSAAQWGNGDRHMVGDLLEIESLFKEIQFDAILCNGIFGFGVNSQEQQEAALRAMHAKLAPRGWLLLSWNRDRSRDPISIGVVDGFFRPEAPEGLHSHYEIVGTTHVYELLRKAD